MDRDSRCFEVVRRTGWFERGNLSLHKAKKRGRNILPDEAENRNGERVAAPVRWPSLLLLALARSVQEPSASV